MKLRLRGSPFLKDYDFDRIPDADNAAVGKYDRSIATGLLPVAFLFSGDRKPLFAKQQLKENEK